MNLIDPHSFSNFTEVVITHSFLNIEVDFNTRAISGYVSHKINNISGASRLVLDTRDLRIDKVFIDGEQEAEYKLGANVEFLGEPLIVNILPETTSVKIYYSSSPEAAAVQWLYPKPEEEKHPFLFTQSEAILARTWIPCQDSPSVRFTYEADVKVPPELMAVMSASNPTKKSEDGKYHFKMDHPIPSYLLALAVGDLKFKAIGKRTGVYAEADMVEKAAYEFEKMEKMVEAAEELYGPYRWERFDVLVLPPSFPFGGMENPRLTFATPTIIAGDRSLVSLIAHELAHSWSGNLVTNATWNDFWLNEGFTVYFERRIMEKLEGKDYADMLALLGYHDLMDTVSSLEDDNIDTCLKLNLEGRDPDDGMTYIAYEKGYFFLLAIEKLIGREKWDAFLNDYFKNFAFQSMDTGRFVEILTQKILKNSKELKETLKAEDWIYKSGIPDNCPRIISNRFEKVESASQAWFSGQREQLSISSSWSTQEWLHFIRYLPSKLSVNQMDDIEGYFKFSDSGNAEILCAWFVHVISNQYSKQYDQVEDFLCTVGRRKFLMPLYNAMLKTDEGKKLVLNIYKKARPGYHYVSYSSLDSLLEKENLRILK